MKQLLISATLLLVLKLCNGSYQVVFPKVLRPGIAFKVGVSIGKTESDVQMSVQLIQNPKARDEKSAASATMTMKSDTAVEANLQVPLVLSGSYAIRVTASGGLRFTNTSSNLEVNQKTGSFLTQTDKGIYKPGETVRMRFVSFKDTLKPDLGPFSVEIYDADNNKIKQWLNETSTSDTPVVGKELAISQQPVLGDWKIKVKKQGETFETPFTIKKYVLPRFEVKVMSESSYLVIKEQKDIHITVKATYTYGKPVKGTADVLITMQNSKFGGLKETIQMGQNGGKLDIAFSSLRDHLQDGVSIRVQAIVKEGLSNTKQNESTEISVHTTPVTIDWAKTNPSSFKPGLRYSFNVKVTLPDGMPLPQSGGVLVVNQQIYLSGKNEQKKTTFSVPASGIVKADIIVLLEGTSLSLTIMYHDKEGGPAVTQISKYLTKFNSIGNHGVQVQLISGSDVKTGGTITFKVKTTLPSVKYTYYILSRGRIVASGEHAGSDVAESTFQVVATSAMAPQPRLVVYQITDKGEVIADSLRFSISEIFENKVGLSLSADRVKPGKPVTVSVSASPNSFVGLLAVDKSVLLLKKGNDITKEKVIAELQAYDASADDESDDGGIQPMFRLPFFPIFGGGNNALEVLKKAGLSMMTDNIFYNEPEIMFAFADAMERAPAPGGARMPNTKVNEASASVAPVTRVRSFFPETWIWQDAIASAGGKVDVETKAPDTITSWEVSAFAVSQSAGLGVVPETQSITVYQDFFISLVLPYSVKRGEKFRLQVLVFNYVQNDEQATITLAKSDDFKVRENGEEEGTSKTAARTVQVKADSSASVSFWIEPQGLGFIQFNVAGQTPTKSDAVERSLRVEPEGTEKTYNIPFTVELSVDNPSFQMDVPIVLPSSNDGLVPDSVKVRVSATGDLMGSTVSGLDRLIRMPYGCGEQNMINFSPSVFVTKYLTATSQLSSEMKKKAEAAMTTGYQRELSYKHTDGSFSAFGNSDPSGSMWLTAFVVKSFRQASGLLYIDDQVLINGLVWMSLNQTAEGEFLEPGRVIHSELQGGSAKGIALTAYVLIAFLENKDVDGGQKTKIQTAISKATAYLEKKLASTEDSYTLSIVTYALTLANSQLAGTAMTKLNKLSIEKDGMKYWTKQPTATPAPATKPAPRWSHFREPVSSDIEMTAYALLSCAAKKDIVCGKPIIKWLTGQQNDLGGYGSTQDTVIGLQAMSEFAALVHAGNKDLKIHVSADNFEHTFALNKENALLLQRAMVPTVPSSLVINASGEGLALVQVSVQYNIKLSEATQDSEFTNIIKTVDKTQNEVELEVCTSYKGQGQTGMVLMTVGYLSGFKAGEEDVDKSGATGDNAVQRLEFNQDNMVLYFNQINKDPTCVKVLTTRSLAVSDLKPAAITVSKYYQQESSSTTYYSPQSQAVVTGDMCSLCEDCSTCVPTTSEPPVQSAPCTHTTLTTALLLLTLSVLATLRFF